MSHVSERLRKGATAVTVGALLSAPMILGTTTAAVGAEGHVDNPYAGATQYVNDKWSAAVTAEAAAVAATNPTLAAQMLAIKDQPTAVWMDRIGAINGNVDGPGLKYHLDAALAQKGAAPIVLNVVIYNLPGRDCYALASNGELPATAAGLTRYKTEYIDPIAELLAKPEYAGIRISATIEPDSLPNLSTNMSEPACQTSAPYYKEGVTYALDKLHAITNVYTYVDAAHSGWLGWENNASHAVQTFVDVATSTKAGFASIDGFVTNTANSTPLTEPYLPDSTLSLSGTPIRSSSFYEWNFDFDEIDWTANLYTRLVAGGFPSTVGMLIDTSRNGWGGPNRPTATSTSSVLETYIAESKVDKRTHRGAWCNPAGAGIGERPQATPAGYTSSHLDAFVWIKPPGESDGSSSLIPNDEGKGFDRMCDPTFSSPKLSGKLTGALPGAPVSGKWFSTQFQQLVTNAYPAIPATGTQPPADTVAPSVPTNLVAGATTLSSIAVSWTASTDNVAVTGYDISSGGVVVGSSPTTSFTVAGLATDTAYTFTVRAKDAAGNVSAASAPLTARTATDVVIPGPDTVAPTAPTNLVAGTTTTSAVPLTWTASTDNVGVTGYDVYSGTTKVGSSTTTSHTVTGLTAGTSYTFTVRAKDAAGNVSVPSAAVTATTQTVPVTPAGSCQVTYSTNDWNSGFTATVKIKNTGTAAINGWSLGFAFPAGQTITNGWSAVYTAAGAAQTITNQSWNGTIAAGQTVEIGFNGSHTGTNTRPTAFTLNGAACS